MNDSNLERKINSERRRAGKRRIINQDIVKVSVFFALLFFALAAFIIKFIAADAGSVINNPYNKRSDSMKRAVTRGDIYAADGEVLAHSDILDDGSEIRVYPFGEDFFHVVGFDSNGGMGIESSYGAEFSGSKVKGDNVHTTLDITLQKKLNEILGDNEGSIIVIDPEDGSILAMVSKPGYDPALIADDWDTITGDPDNTVLLNRATQAALTPGSTFKIFTLMEFYRQSMGDTDDYSFTCEGRIISDDGSVARCPSESPHGTMDIRTAFAYSCNCAFANIGLELDLDRFAEDNRQLLFNTDLDLDFPTVQSSFDLDGSSSEFMVMQTSFGQGETLVSPIHLAMISAAAANGGVLMKPHLVSHITDSTGRTVNTMEPEKYAVLFTPEEAGFLKSCMRAVVTNGTAAALSYEGNYTAYGKTGTAQTGGNDDESHDHSWFTGFAEKNGHSVAICAMIENTQEAGLTGVSAAGLVFDEYFGY